MTPKLALGYSSTAGPSPYGYGWSLPVGRIERTTRWGSPRCDSLYFEDFVMVLPGGVTAELVADPPGSNEFRPRVEQSYLSATLSPGTNSWTARDGTGNKYTFGSVDDARLGTIVANPPLEQSNPDGSCDFTTAWALTDIEDRNGNTISISWTDKGNNGNQLLPQRVEYGGNTAGLNHFHTVSFDWLSSTPSAPTYRGGAPQQIATRLWRIRVGTAKSPSGDFRTYTMIGVGEGAEYQLQTVTATDLPEQNFIYEDWVTDPGHAAAVAEPVHNVAFDAVRVWSSDGDVLQTLLDMNGDGLLDLVRGNFSSTVWDVHFGTILKDPVSGEALDFDFESTATQWATTSSKIRGVTTSNCIGSETCTTRDTFDITGDGVPDMVVATTDDGYWYVEPGGKSGTSWGFGQSIPWPSPIKYIRRSDTGWTTQDVVDMTGDGLPDLVLSNAQTGFWEVYRNTGTGFDLTPILFPLPDPDLIFLHKSDSTDQTTVMLTDFNGDGLPDLLQYTPLGGFQNPPGSGQYYYEDAIKVFWNTGQGFTSTPHQIPVPNNRGCMPNNNIVDSVTHTVADLLDINGDGLPDCVYDDGTEWRVLLNTGGDLEPVVYPPPSGVGGYYAYAPRVWTGVNGDVRQSFSGSGGGGQLIDMVDLTGDGFLDRVEAGLSPGSWNVEANLQPRKPRVLTMMENGLGGTNTIKYEPSSHFVHVDEDGAPTLPFITWVTTATRLNDGQCVPPAGADVFETSPAEPTYNPCVGAGSEQISFVEYSDGLFAVDSNSVGDTIREFRGFGSVMQSDVFGNSTRTNFRQGANDKGLVESVWTYGPNEATVVRVEINTWAEAPFGTGNARTQLWLSGNSRANFDGATLADILASNQYNDRPDQYGNIVHTWTSGTFVPYDVNSTNEFASPANADSPRDKPMRTVVWDDANGNGVYEAGAETLLEETKFYYDLMGYGEVDLGNLTRIDSRLIDDNGDRWVTTSTSYDVYGNITKVTDALNRETNTEYDADGEGALIYPIRITNALGHTTTTDYDYRHGKPSSVTGPNGPSTTVNYVYDALGRVILEIAPGDTFGSPTVLYTYDFPTAPPPSSTDPWPLSSVKVERKQDGYATGRSITTYFDALGRTRYSVSPRVIGGGPGLTDVRSSEVVFDPGGNVIRNYSPYPDGGTQGGFTAYDYHLNGDPSLIDPLGRVWKTTLPDGASETITHYIGHRAETYDLAGEKSITFIDGMGREVRREIFHRPPPGNDTHTLFATSASVYDGLGRLLESYQNRELADQWMKKFRYDTLGRKIETIDRDSGTWTYGYDDVGNLLWQDDPKADQHMQFCYDAGDRPTRKCSFTQDYADLGQHVACQALYPLTCAGELDVYYEYDDGTLPLAQGALTKVIDEAGEMRSLGFDARGRQIGTVRKIDVDADVGEAEVRYVYNTTGEVVETTYPDGEVVQVTFDESGQPTSLGDTEGYFYVDSAHYDIFGRLTNLGKGNGVDDVASYHPQAKNDRLAQIQFDATSFDYTLGYEYTARGQIDTITDWVNPTSSLLHLGGNYSYDDLGRLIGVTSNNTAIGTRAFAYDNWGNITRNADVTMAYPDPTAPLSAPHQVEAVNNAGANSTAIHDANGNRLSMYQSPGTGSNGVAVFNAEDRVSTVNTAGSTVDFLYDDSGQLRVKVVDDGGTPRVTKYYNRLVEVRPDGSTIKSYFFGGQRVASSIEADSSWQTTGLASLMWESPVDFASKWASRPVLLVSLSSTGQSAAMTGLGLVFVALFLMPAGRRRRAVVGLRLSRTTAVWITLLFVTGTLPWPMLIQPAGAACTGCDCPTPTIPTDISYFHYDHLGSPVAITDGAGDLVEQIRYDPYGAVRGRFDGTGTAIGEPSPDDVRYEFTGYEAERTTGLLYANARFYDPELGSFLSHDPATQFASPYSYVGWDPANANDPTGAFVCLGLCVALVAFAIGFAASAINAAIQGASFGDALLSGLIGGATAVIGYGIGSALTVGLANVLAPIANAVGVAGGKLASGILFVSGLGQAGYGASQGDYAAVIGLGLGLTVGAVLGTGAQPSAPGDSSSAAQSREGAIRQVATSSGPKRIEPVPPVGQGRLKGTGAGVLVDSAGQIVGANVQLTADRPLQIQVNNHLTAIVPPNTRIGIALRLGGGFQVETSNRLVLDITGPLNGSISTVSFDGSGVLVGNDFRFAGFSADGFAARVFADQIGTVPGLVDRIDQGFFTVNRLGRGL